MAEAPTNDEVSPDLQIAKYQLLETPKSVEVESDVTIAHLSTSKTSPPAPLTPSNLLSVKRKRLKPVRFVFSSTKVEKKHSPSKTKVIRDPSRTSKTKDSDARIQISPTMIRAKEVQSSLGNDHPGFIKTMLKSHVASCFWMGLPVPFCKSFLPKDDSSMVAEDENGQQYDLKFLANKTGLSAGWRNFALKHKLLEGDVLIFQLVESCKFKVYVVRANDSKEVDGVLNLLNHDAHTEHITPATIKTYSKSKAKKCSSSSSLPLTTCQKKPKMFKPPLEHSYVDSDIEGGSGSLKPNLSIEVKTFNDFHIMVNKQYIDSELSEEIRMNYYKLCIEKNEILHDGVPESLYHKLVAGMIGETVSIANKIKKCKLTTTKEEFNVWDSSLKSFELIGMKVGFLRDRIRVLTTLAFESQDAKKYVEAKEEKKLNDYTIKNLEAKLAELKESNKKIDDIVGGLKEKAENYEVEFQKMVDASW